MQFLAALLLAVAPYASKTPLPKPVVFAPGVISTGDYESHQEFSPDGMTLYYLKAAPDFSFWTIVSSQFRDGAWQAPQVAPWSGRYRDADPFITPDGQRMYFISDRPFNDQPKHDLDIWMMEKSGSGWGAPRHLDAPVNSPGDEWFPTIAADGTIYFGSDREGGLGRTDLYRCRRIGDHYGPAENLGPNVNSAADEYEPLINADQSRLIFMASRRKDGLGSGDLYVSAATDGVFEPARNLGAPINSAGYELAPRFSPDGKWFFFTSTRGVFQSTPFPAPRTTQQLLSILHGPGNGLGDIYQVDARAVE